MTERFTVDSDGKYWDKINHEYVTLDSLFRTVEQLDKEIKELKEANNQKIEIIEVCLDETELLKEALREELQDNGNAYYIRLFDDLFDLEYDKWNMNEPYRECTDWEKILKEKDGDVE